MTDFSEHIQDGYDLLLKATAHIDPNFPTHWRSPVTMPLWAVREWALIEDVRPERLDEKWWWRIGVKRTVKP